MRHCPRPALARDRGFTLVELLVAIAVMALMTLLSWRGLDGMARTEAQTRQRADEVLTVQASLAQWQSDLDALALDAEVSALDWDGRLLRLTRRASGSAAEGLQVVAWTRRTDFAPGQWMRWQSPPVRTRSAWNEAWLRAQLWLQNASSDDRQREVALIPLEDWRIFYFRNDAWSNPLSSDGPVTTTATAGATATASAVPGSTSVPEGIRLVLTLPPGRALAGQLTLDWVRPTVGGGKS